MSLEPGLGRLPGLALGKLKIAAAGADIDPLLSEPLPLPILEPKVEKPDRQPRELRPLPQGADKPLGGVKVASHPVVMMLFMGNVWRKCFLRIH